MQAKLVSRAEGFKLEIELTQAEHEKLSEMNPGMLYEPNLDPPNQDLAKLAAAADGKHTGQLVRIEFKVKRN
jgi:hypothetical protein